MSGKRTIWAAVLVFAGLTTGAEARGALFETFATCVGRYSAQMEHAWLMADPAADTFLSERGVMLTLLDATVPSNKKRDALHLRIDAKHAQAMLLTSADFGTDPDRALKAREIANTYISGCRSLILGS